ncbi:DUF2617 family protein [Halocatena pleomorpha]|nr:DUF2617 family protein [Halocatena pleomorpha]
MTDSSIVSEQLYFTYTRTPLSLDQFDVKRTVSAELFGTSATLTIIGSSHYIASRRLGFHELCSCRPLHAESMASVSLLESVDRSFTFENDHLSASTTLETRPLSDRPAAARADIAYRFGPDAWTMIRLTTEGYETYHTYPEYDCTLYSQTRLTAVTDDDSSDTEPPRTTDCRIQTD